METQDKVFAVLVAAFVTGYAQVVTTTDLGGWLVFISMLLMWVGALLIALMLIPMVPDFLPDDIVALILYLGVFLQILWFVIGLCLTQFKIADVL